MARHDIHRSAAVAICALLWASACDRTSTETPRPEPATAATDAGGSPVIPPAPSVAEVPAPALQTPPAPPSAAPTATPSVVAPKRPPKRRPQEGDQIDGKWYGR